MTGPRWLSEIAARPWEGDSEAPNIVLGVAERDRLVAAVRALREALKRYGQHESDCALLNLTPGNASNVAEKVCDCGFAAALAETGDQP